VKNHPLSVDRNSVGFAGLCGLSQLVYQDPLFRSMGSSRMKVGIGLIGALSLVDAAGAFLLTALPILIGFCGYGDVGSDSGGVYDDSRQQTLPRLRKWTMQYTLLIAQTPKAAAIDPRTAQSHLRAGDGFKSHAINRKTISR